MQIIYIKKESKEKEKKKLSLLFIFKKVVNELKCFFGKIKFQKYENNKSICYLPYHNDLTKKEAGKVVKKLDKKVKKKECAIVLYRQGQGDQELRGALVSRQYTILNGRWLYSYLFPLMIEYIGKKQKKKIEEYMVSVLVKEATRENKEKIMSLARQSKIFKYY